MRVDAVWCSRACYIRVKREGNRYEPPTRRPTRDGSGVRLYLSQREAEALLQRMVPTSVVEKIIGKLKDPEPLPGQTNIIDALKGVEHGDDASQAEAQAQAS